MFNDFFQKMVEEMYEVEVSAHLEELENARFTATVPVTDLYMIDLIAARFGQSRSSIVNEILSHAAKSMFSALKDDDRDQISKAADDLVDGHMKKNSSSYSRDGLGYWEAMNQAVKGSQDADS